MTVSAMLGLQRLLDGGYEVTFRPGDGAVADDGRSYECRMVTPEGKTVTAGGAVPSEAMRAAAQLQGDGCQVTYASAADGAWFADLRDADGRCVQTGLGATKAMALAHLRERLRPGGRVVFDPSVGEPGLVPDSSPTCSDRLASLETWADGIRARLDARVGDN
jgi:hypothetical protein